MLCGPNFSHVLAEGYLALHLTALIRAGRRGGFTIRDSLRRRLACLGIDVQGLSTPPFGDQGTEDPQRLGCRRLREREGHARVLLASNEEVKHTSLHVIDRR